MYTQCPNCETYFQISAEHLKVAQGNVRCGQCQHVFSALGNLSEEPPPRATPPRPVPRAKKTEVAKKQQQKPQPPAKPAQKAPAQTATPKAAEPAKAPQQQPSAPKPAPAPRSAQATTETQTNNDAITNIRRLNEASTKLQTLAEGQANYVEKLKQQQEELSKFLSQTKAKAIPPLNIPNPEMDKRQSGKDRNKADSGKTDDGMDLNQAFQAIDELQDSLKQEAEQEKTKNAPSKNSKDIQPKDVLPIDALEGIDEQIQEDDSEDIEDFLTPNENADSIVDVRRKKQLFGKSSAKDKAKPKEKAQTKTKDKAKTRKPKPTKTKAEAQPATQKKAAVSKGEDSPASMSTPPPAPRQSQKESVLTQAKADAADTQMIVPKQLLEDHIDEQLSLMHYRNNLVWSTGCLIMMLFFLGQTVYFKHDELARVEGMRSWVVSFCDKFNCTVDPQTDITQLELVGQDIRTHAKNKSALSINATIINNASFEQPFPALEIRFSDLNGQPVAKRRFLPGEYMSSQQKADSMLPNTPIQVHLDILDPGSAAVNFEFGFLEL